MVLGCQVLNCRPAFGGDVIVAFVTLLLKKETLFGDNGGFAERRFKRYSFKSVCPCKCLI